MERLMLMKNSWPRVALVRDLRGIGEKRGTTPAQIEEVTLLSVVATAATYPDEKGIQTRRTQRAVRSVHGEKWCHSIDSPWCCQGSP